MKKLRALVTVPLRFVRWVYRRGPYEPESSARRIIDSQASARSPVYQVGMQEVHLSERKLRDAADAHDVDDGRPG